MSQDNNTLENLPVDAVLALSKLADKGTKECKSARKYIQPGRTYKGSLLIDLHYELHATPPGKDAAIPLNAWAILAAVLDTPDGVEIVQDAAERAHHYRESLDHVKQVAKDAAQETWLFTRPSSMRITVKNDLREAVSEQHTKAGGE